MDPKPPCVPCNGSGLRPLGAGMRKCGACRGTGISGRWLREETERRRVKNWARYDKAAAELDLLRDAVAQFKPRTNLDGVIMTYAQAEVRRLEIQIIGLKPRGKRP